jgi:acetylglutamate kinase
MHMSHNYATLDGELIVLKYGGNAMPDERTGKDPVLEEVGALWTGGSSIVIVHGGGPEIDDALAEQSVPTRRVDGLRVTDRRTLTITEAVLCGTVNKRIVRALLAIGVPAVGISGEDAGMLRAVAERSGDGTDLGYVGRVVHVDARLVRALLDAELLPVIAPLAISIDASHAYNVNADLSAGALAGALHAAAFIAVTNVPRVYRDPTDAESGIDRMSVEEARAFAKQEACASSMKPKLCGAITALDGGAEAAYICAPSLSTISSALAGDATVIAGNTSDNKRRSW